MVHNLLAMISRLFLGNQGIKHTPVPTYHPASNGQAERFVQTFKKFLKKMKYDKMTLKKKIHQGLLAYRSAPHALTNESPANLFLGRPLRTKLSQIQPSTSKVVSSRNQNIAERNGRRETTFVAGEKVLTLSFKKDKKWLNGTVVEAKGPRNYMINIQPWANTPLIVKRHVDQMLRQPYAGTEPVHDWGDDLSQGETIGIPLSGTQQVDNQSSNLQEATRETPGNETHESSSQPIDQVPIFEGHGQHSDQTSQGEPQETESTTVQPVVGQDRRNPARSRRPHHN